MSADAGTYALLQAASNGNLGQVKMLVGDGVAVNIHDSNGQTPLIISSEKGFLDIVEELVECGADPNESDGDGWTALIAASKEGHTEVVALLLKHGANYNICDLGGWTPLVWASYKGYSDIVKELLTYGADPNAKGEHNMTALIWACGRGHDTTVVELIAGGAEPDVADKYGTSALVWACRKGHYNVVQILLQKGVDCNTAGTHGWTPLIMAAKGGYVDVINLLLAESPNVNAVDQDGRSALAWCAKEGHNDIVVKLLQKGAFLNMPDRHSDTPLLLACKEGHADVTRTLLHAYADIEMVGAEGKTPLYVAVEKGHVDVVNELLCSGANMEAVNKEGETSLLRGAKKKHTQCVKQLLEKGANISAVDKKGDNLLHIVVRNRFAGMCELVLQDPKHAKLLRQPNKSGVTPLMIDGKNKHKMLVQPSVESSQPNASVEYSKMDLVTQQEILLCTLGKFLVEPSLCIPMTIGIYSRWGSGKSSYLQQLVELLEEFKDQVPLKPFTITFLLTLACCTTGINFGIILWAVKSENVGIICGICVAVLLMFIFLFTRVSVTCVNKRIRRLGIGMTLFLHRMALLLKLVYCVPPSTEEFRSILPVHLIMVDLSQSAFLADSPMASLVGFTRELNDAVESDLGVIIPRLYRIFQSAPYRNHPGADISFRPHWKLSCCCIPSFLITVLIFLCLWIGIILYNVYQVNGPSTVIAVQIACCCVFGGGLVSYILRSFVMTYCMCLPMKKRVKIVANQAGIQEETFLSVLKQELDLYVDMLESIDGFNHRQTRVVIHIDLVDSLEQQKVLTLINTINLLVTEPGHPFILVISVDPRLLIKAIDQTLSSMQGAVINPCEYLKNMVDLPFYINEYPKLQAERLIPSEMCQQLEEKLDVGGSGDELEYDNEWMECGDDMVSATSGTGNEPLENGHVPLDNGTLERSVKFPSNDSISSSQQLNVEGEEEEENISEDISHLLRNNENNTLNDVKRIMNVVSLTGRLLRYHDVPFQWTRLAIWVSFCDGWPYKASWMTLLCLDSALELPGTMSIRRLHSLFGFMVPVIGDRNLGIENSTAYFDTFIASHRPVINVSDARSFADFMFYIDPTIRKLMIDYLMAIRSAKPNSLQQTISGGSFSATSPNNNPFLWACSVSREFLIRMTVDDVASQLLEIEGLEESLLLEYKNRLIDNNINGRVLVACDLNELQEVMSMKFGDWQLFRAWIMTSRNNDPQMNNRFEEKLSTDRSTGCLNSFLEGSQSEWSPSTPKQSTCGSMRQNEAYRLPSLTEKVDTSNNEPYSSHSPRLTPHLSRKSLKHSKTSAVMSVSQDSDGNGSAPNNPNNPVLHHSADSGFASTEVDQNHRLMLSLQRQMCISDPHKLLEQNENVAQVSPLATATSAKTTSGITEVCNDVVPSASTENLPLSVSTLVESHFSPNPEFTTNTLDTVEHISKASCSSTDDNERSHLLFDNEFILPQPDNEHPRPPSLSEVPLPPLSMLSEDIAWTMDPPAEFDDNTHPLPPSPPGSLGLENVKLMFRNVSNPAVSYEHSQSVMDSKDNDMCSRSEPYMIEFDSRSQSRGSGGPSSVKKSASLNYYDGNKRSNKFRYSTTSENENLLDNEESKM